MAKKSFFSKLMGNEIVDESAEETQISSFSFKAEENDAPGQTYQNSEQEWTPEYEGQLTVDVFQTKDDVVIQSIVAGVKPEDVDITIANDKVTIEGERKKTAEVQTEDYFYQECYWGPFSRSIVLPVDVDVDNVDAKIKDGILTVTLPKAAKAKIRKVQVKKMNE